MKYIYAAARSAALLALSPVIFAVAALQGFVIGPLTGNYKVIPNFVYNLSRKVAGIKIEFNAASAPLEKSRQVWFVANHLSNSDFMVLGSVLNGTFAGKGDIMKWPVIAQLARSVKYIGLRRSKEFNPLSRAKIIENFNAGQNTIMFPEGTTTDGKEVCLFHAGLLTILFGDKGVDKKGREVALQKDVIVQPLAIRVKSINGQDAIGNDDLRNMYSMPQVKSTFAWAWKQMMIRETVIEVSAFPPLEPANFKDEKDLINEAGWVVRRHVAPGQTDVKKAHIPGQKKKPDADMKSSTAPAPV